jgi:hypothetical protein
VIGSVKRARQNLRRTQPSAEEFIQRTAARRCNSGKIEGVHPSCTPLRSCCNSAPAKVELTEAGLIEPSRQRRLGASPAAGKRQGTVVAAKPKIAATAQIHRPSVDCSRRGLQPRAHGRRSLALLLKLRRRAALAMGARRVHEPILCAFS